MKSLYTFYFALLMVLMGGLGQHQALAVLIVDAGRLLNNPVVVDFSQFATCNFAAPGCTAADLPDVGGLVGEAIEFSGTPTPSGASLYGFDFSLDTNGDWDSGRVGYAGNANPSAFMVFRFLDGPVCGVGGFVNYAPGFGIPRLEALDANLNVLETYAISVRAPISTPGALNDGAFRGILRVKNDIFAIRWSNSFSVLDDLTFSRACVSSIPTLSEWGLIAMAGILGIVGFMVLRRRQVTA